MKFANKSRIKEQLIDFVAKGILILFSGLVCLWMISGAKASTVDIVSIKSSEVDGQYVVDFHLSKNLKKEDVQVEYQRNFVQISFQGVSAYPARTEKLNHPITEKVFTYQYQPDLARARILLNSPASSIQDSSSYLVEGKTVRFFLKAGNVAASSASQSVKDEVRTTASAVSTTKSKNSRASSQKESTSIGDLAAKTSQEDPEEAKLRNELLSGKTNVVEEKKGNVTSASAGLENTENLPLFTKAEEKAKASEQDKESPAAKVMASLLLVVGLIAAVALGFRKFVLGKHSPFQKQTRMIQVVSSQALGPKRSIAVVKVLDQHLVVGMSGDNMNLLVNLGTNVNLDSFSDEVGGGISFSETLTTAVRTDALDREEARLQKSSSNLGFRATLKKRLEGLKPL